MKDKFLQGSFGICLVMILLFSAIPAYAYPGASNSSAAAEAPGRGLNRSEEAKENIACAADAKRCPDGSYVGRVAPHCDFAPCPGEKNETDEEEKNQTDEETNETDSEDYFWAPEPDEYQYVRLGQKFELEAGESAVVVDRGDMKVYLREVLFPECMGCPPMAQLGVSQAYNTNSRAPNNTARMYPEKLVQVEEGDSEEVFGAVISFLEWEGGNARFIVEQKSGNYVDVKIDPTRTSVELGESAKYNIVIKDRHSETGDGIYKYKISVLDLPFSADYEDSVALFPGEQEEFPLSILTGFAIDSDYDADSEGYQKAARTRASNVTRKMANATMNITPEEARERVELYPSVTASGRAYKFRVVVTGSDGSEATAYAVLNVLYSPPPPPRNETGISLQKGWNLVSLPGEGELSAGTCSGMDDLYAFVYISGLGEYMTLQEASDYMGEKELKEYLKLNSFWAYSYRDCRMKFALEEPTSFNELELEGGWNFVPVTEDMEGNSLSDIGGNCAFERSYYWDADKQDWKTLDEGRELEEEQLYHGLVAKVENTCEFGWGAIVAPPSLPE
jgi:hypothetical protein